MQVCIYSMSIASALKEGSHLTITAEGMGWHPPAQAFLYHFSPSSPFRPGQSQSHSHASFSIFTDKLAPIVCMLEELETSFISLALEKN